MDLHALFHAPSFDVYRAKYLEVETVPLVPEVNPLGVEYMLPLQVFPPHALSEPISLLYCLMTQLHIRHFLDASWPGPAEYTLRILNIA